MDIAKRIMYIKNKIIDSLISQSLLIALNKFLEVVVCCYFQTNPKTYWLHFEDYY